MKKSLRVGAFLSAAALLLSALAAGTVFVRYAHLRRGLPQARPVGARAEIYPDYYDIVIPPNIAPVNFMIEEPGGYFCARLFDGQGNKRAEIFSRDGKIRIPQGPWRRMLSDSRGGTVRIEVYTLDGGRRWLFFEPFEITVAREPVDDYLTYRKLHSAYNLWHSIAIYQRRLSTFEEIPVADNVNFPDRGTCFNCHTFSSAGDGNFLMQVRDMRYGPSIVMYADGEVKSVDARTPRLPGTPGFSSWHPDGGIVAMSINGFQQFFPTAGRDEPREVVDLRSNLVLYDVSEGNVIIYPELARRDRLETYPVWSPDGRYLYFSRAVPPWSEYPSRVLEVMDMVCEVKYDLCRVSFDVDTMSFGEVETLLSSRDTGMSMTQPKISPDGRWLTFVMHDYGTFPTFQDSSDIWMMDLRTEEAFPMEGINSDRSDSWRSWSGNGRWLVFASKRDSKRINYPYLAYIDDEGNPSKPFLVPQEDPSYYRKCYENFNVLELSSYPVPVSRRDITRLISRPHLTEKALPPEEEPPLAPGGH